MNAQLEPGLKLVDSMPQCIRATFSSAAASSFQSTSDDRGQAYVFDREEKPAVLIEVIHTEPFKVRGNHIHQNCDETFSVVSGALEFYVLCDCSKKHVYMQVMKSGDSVLASKGIAHAMFSQEKTEFVALFDHDPRNDRERVPIIIFQ